MGTLVTSSDLLAGTSALVVAYGGMFVLAGLLPIVAGFILDGVVQVLRSNGLRFFFLAVGLTVVVAGVGYVISQFGSHGATMTVANQVSLNEVGRLFLTFSIPLGLFAFLVRTVKLLFRSRRSA
jgi:hypothetical protein